MCSCIRSYCRNSVCTWVARKGGIAPSDPSTAADYVNRSLAEVGVVAPAPGSGGVAVPVSAAANFGSGVPVSARTAAIASALGSLARAVLPPRTLPLLRHSTTSPKYPVRFCLLLRFSYNWLVANIACLSRLGRTEPFLALIEGKSVCEGGKNDGPC
jgi:hypothetical protein